MVLILCYLLIFFYVFLMIFRFFQTGPLTYWKSFSKIQFSLDTNFGDCTSDVDCSSSEKCMSLGQPSKQCVPKYRGDHQCNPFTGTWALSQEKDGTYFVKCVCKYPDLVTQKADGADCNVDVACGEHGHLETLQVDPFRSGNCLCEKDYLPDRTHRGPFCRRLMPSDIRFDSCETPRYLPRTEAQRIYHPAYLAQFPDNCFRNPCSLNPLNNEELKHTELHPEKGCICDPHWGNFGIRFEGINYLKLPGYSACVNVFGKEPDSEIDVELYTHYFIRDDDPHSFIHFIDLDPSDVDPILRDLVKNGTLQVQEIWPHNYTQHVLRNLDYDVRSRQCTEVGVFGGVNCEEYVLRPKMLVNCKSITQYLLEDKFDGHSLVYELLYRSPLCYWSEKGKYHDTFIVNPHLMSFNNHKKELFRSNALVLKKINNGRWLVDLADSKYHAVLENSTFPDLTDAYVVSLVYQIENTRIGQQFLSTFLIQQLRDLMIFPITVNRFNPVPYGAGDY